MLSALRLIRSRRPLRRDAVSLPLLVAGGVLMLFAAIAIWAEQALFDADGFVENAEEALADDDVRSVAVDELVLFLEERGSPELITFRPVTTATLDTVLESSAFAAIFREAIRDTHDLIFTEDGGTIIRLTGVFSLLAATVEIDHPEVAEAIPETLTDGVVSVQDRDWTEDLLDLAEDVRFLAAVLPVAAVAVTSASVWAAPRRRRAVVRAGAAAVIAAIVLFVAKDALRDVVLPEIDNGERELAARAIWGAFTNDLTRIAAVLGAAGLALAVAASTTLPRGDVRTQLAQISRPLLWAPRSRSGQLLRAGAIALSGWLILTRGDAVLDVVLFAAGAYLLYLGLAELIALSGIGPGESEPPAPQPTAGVERATRAASGVAFVAIVGLCVVVLLWLFGLFADEDGDGEGRSIEACNGHAELCDRRLDEVTFPATHNSMSAASEPGWFLAAQGRGIVDQLEAGVRGLLIDTAYGIDTGRLVVTDRVSDLSHDELVALYGQERVSAYELAVEGLSAEGERRLYLCHAFCELGATELVGALREIRGFLLRNPNEVLLIFIQDMISPVDTAAAFEESGLIDLVYTHREVGEPFPTLRELIERDARVVVLAENDSDGFDWYHDGFLFAQDTRFDYASAEEFDCALNRGSSDSPLFLLNHWTLGKVNASVENNSFDVLAGRARRCELERGRRVNLLAIDQYQNGDLFAVADALNGVGP